VSVKLPLAGAGKLAGAAKVLFGRLGLGLANRRVTLLLGWCIPTLAGNLLQVLSGAENERSRRQDVGKDFLTRKDLGEETVLVYGGDEAGPGDQHQEFDHGTGCEGHRSPRLLQGTDCSKGVLEVQVFGQQLYNRRTLDMQINREMGTTHSPLEEEGGA
jgi:hypothetical protein